MPNSTTRQQEQENEENDANSVFVDVKTYDVEDEYDSEKTDEIQILLAESQLLTQRNQHYCNYTLLKRFRRLIRVDFPELIYTPTVKLDDISDAKQCHKQVINFCITLNQEIWPTYQTLHKKVLKLRRLSRSLPPTDSTRINSAQMRRSKDTNSSRPSASTS